MLQKVSCNNDSPSLLVAQCATEGTCDTPLLSESIPSYTNSFDIFSVVSLSELGPALSFAPNSAEVGYTPPKSAWPPISSPVFLFLINCLSLT